MAALRDYLVFDFETTGLDPATERIIQVGVARVANGEIAEHQGWLVDQDHPVDPDAQRIHGISREKTREGLKPEISLLRLLAMMQAAPVCIGHNIHRFDVPFLRSECDRLGLAMPEWEGYVDTAAHYKGRRLRMTQQADENEYEYALRVLSRRVPGLRYSIDECLKELGIRFDRGSVHDAAADASATHHIYQALFTDKG